jgi:predicted nucleic acid-binding protein
MSYLLDTSAWLAHLFAEPGAEEINQLFGEPQADVYISVLSLPETFARLKAIGKQAQWHSIRAIYGNLFTGALPVDEQIATSAVELRSHIVGRLPTIDGLIAATAIRHKLTLVHRDSHFAVITTGELKQLRLPDK